MNGLIKNIGLIIELIGVALLIIPKVMESTTNTTLIAGGSCLVLGVIAHVVINKFVK